MEGALINEMINKLRMAIESTILVLFTVPQAT